MPKTNNIQDQLEKLRHDYQMLFQNMTSAFAFHKIITNEKGEPVDYQFIDVNPEFEKQTGLKRDDILNKRVLEVLPDLEKEWIEKFGSVALTGKPIEYTNYAESLDRYYETRAYCPKIGYFAVTFHEITEKKKTEQALLENQKKLKKKNEDYEAINEELMEVNEKLYEKNLLLNKAKDKAQESDKLKTAFLCNMSHEIRTPLNGITGFADLLSPELLEDKFLSYISIIQKSSDQLVSIIDNILDLSKIESGSEELILQTFNVNEELDDLYNKFLIQIDSSQIGFRKICAPKNITVNTDKIKFNQIFNNLISNAIKFTESGTISFGYNEEGDKLIFFVSDTGIGIDKKYHEDIFERFRQIETLNNKIYRGSGIGLALVKSYLNLMEGEVWLESEPGKGSTFYFTLNPDAYTTAIPKEQSEEKDFNLEICGKNILIVEDDAINSDLLYETLKPYNSAIITASNGIEAINIIKNYPLIDIVLLDIKMPYMNGYETLKEIRKINKNIPVIAQTAYALEEDRMKAERAGFDAFLAKPIKSKTLYQLICKILNAKKVKPIHDPQK